MPTVNHEAGVPGHTQCHVQDGPVLRDVYVLAAEHRIAAAGEVRFRSELDEESDGLFGDPVLRVVEIYTDSLSAQPLGATRVIGEQLTKMSSFDVGVVVLERLPGRTFAQRGDGHEPSIPSSFI